MKEVSEYRGFKGSYEFDESANRYHGRLTNTSDLVTFECTDENDIEKEFKLAVDDYLVFKRSKFGYKGFVYKYEFDRKSKLFIGQVYNTEDIITFTFDNVSKGDEEFKRTVDNYLALKAKFGNNNEVSDTQN